MPNVTINLAYLMGSPVAGAYVKAQLITPDVLTDTIVQKRHLVDGYTDESGSLVLSLAANEGAPVYSYYRVRAWHPLTRQKVLDIAAFIPAQDCNLHETQYLRYPPNVDLRTLPISGGEECSIPGEPTNYIFIPYGGMSGDRVAGWYTMGYIYEFVGGTFSILQSNNGFAGILWHIDGHAPEEFNLWVPGEIDTLTPLDQVSGNAIFADSFSGAEVDLNDAEMAFLELSSSSAYSSADAVALYDYGACLATGLGERRIRCLPSFHVTDLADRAFDIYPSALLAPPEQPFLCGGMISPTYVMCRAYPL